MPPKKRPSSDVSHSAQTAKRARPDSARFHPNAQQTERFGIVNRDFYPPEMSNQRCEAYNDGILERPIETLQRAFEDTGEAARSIQPNATVVHWFRSDLRLHDNRALLLAYKTACDHGIPLIALYVLSPEDLVAHIHSPSQIYLILRTLGSLKHSLGKLNIPLHMVTEERRADIPSHVVDLCQRWGVNNLYANLQYEVDELRRDAKLIRLCAQRGVKFEGVHDTCVVPPGLLAAQHGQGKQYAVYSPWYRSWVSFLESNPDCLELVDKPGVNPGNPRDHLRELFESEVPSAPTGKRLSDEEKDHFQKLYPEGEDEAICRLETFLEKKGKRYKDQRDIMAAENTSILSPYFAIGVLSARTAVSKAVQANGNRLDRGEPGYVSWISEVAWRDFYKHVLVHWPFICMNKCFKPEFTSLEWEYDEDHFAAWCEGRTGFPIVDAAMRQLASDAWMHNRARMVVSSFLSKDLLIDWRRGEQYFMNHLIDGDFASNHGGWGFGSSTGVDPQPYFRIINPLRQSERFDADGEYIRRWVPELRHVTGKAIHDPYQRGASDIAEKNGYPRPVVDHSQTRRKALDRYKRATQK